MNERLLKIRKSLRLNQEEFGKKIELSKPSISALENGTREITDRTVKLICTEFNVNEDWFRTGEGEMFIETDSSILTELATQYNLDSLDISIIELYAKLKPEDRKTMKNFVKAIAKSIKDDEEIATTIDEVPQNTFQNEDNSIERELTAYRLELEAEKKGKISSVSENLNERLG